MIRYTLTAVCMLTLMISCGPDKPAKVPQEKKTVRIPAFDEQSAYDYISAQVEDIGYRHPGSPGAKKAVDWMYNTLSSFEGWEVNKQVFDATIYTGDKFKGVNIIGRYNPEVQERVLLCAHWDSRFIADKDSARQDQPILGANDGASGVGALMEIAKTISSNPIPMGVDIVFFDLEDQGEEGAGNAYSWGLGSQFFAKNLPEKSYQIKYGILLDMVGAKGATFPKEGYSMRAAPTIVNRVWDIARILKKQDYFVNMYAGGITDDHFFLQEIAGLPVINIIHVDEAGFMAEHHTHGDDMNIIDKEVLDAVGQVVLTTIYKESNGVF